MHPAYNPSAAAAAASRPGHQSAVQSPPDVAMDGRNQHPHASWADTHGQLDYFASAGYGQGDNIYSTALTPGGTFVAISPVRRSNPANAASVPTAVSFPSASAQSYPTQELNRSSFHPVPSPPTSGFPQAPPLPPPNLDILAGVASGATGLTQDVLDSFEIDGADAAPRSGAGLKTEGLGVQHYSEHAASAPTRVSTSPCTTSKTRAKKKAAKGKAKKGASIRVTSLDILRGRGGHTNRHAGNQRFRDEARAMRGEYRDKNTSRTEKLALSKALVRRVEEYGGRFLEKKDGKWCIMGKEDSRKKASQVLREEKWN